MTSDDMNPDDLRDAWRERRPKLEGLIVRKAQSGELTFKIGDNRLSVFLRSGKWFTRRVDGCWDKRRRAAWTKSPAKSFPLASFEDLERLVTDLQATEGVRLMAGDRIAREADPEWGEYVRLKSRFES